MEPTSPDDAPEESTPEPDAVDATNDDAAPEAPRQRRNGILIGTAVAVIVVIAVVAIIVIAGGGGSKSKVATGDTPNASSIAPTTGPPTTLSTLQLPPFTDDPTIACRVDGLLPFPASKLNGPTGAEKDLSPEAEAFRADLNGPNSGLFDDSGRIKAWRLVVSTKTDALFLGGEGLQRVSQHYQFKDGRWAWIKFDSCGSTTVVDPDLNVVALNLDNAHEVDENTTQVHLKVTELACNGGVSLTRERVVGPQVHVDADRVVISMAAQKPAKPISKSCVSTDPIDITVDLGEPLGSRPLLNGNRFPYKPIS